MTPTELTEQFIRKLLADLDPDLATLDRIAEVIQDASGRRSDSKDDAAARAFLAMQLHNYYTAMEKVLERILRVVDGAIPTGGSWHRELLDQAARPAPDLRPAIVDPDVAGELDRLRSFRHFFRNAYTVELQWGELEAHRARVQAIHPGSNAGLSRLKAHLEATLKALDGTDEE